MEGKFFEYFPIAQGVVQGCTLLLTFFLIYAYSNGLLYEIEKNPELDVKLSKNKMFSLYLLMISYD